jgi:hypothetical protein
MRPAASVVVDEALWEATLLSADSELLLGAARNYLGPVKTPYDKRDIVARLRAFLARAETRRAILELLDGLDARILASLFLLGPMPEAELRSLFEGELPLFDLGVRLANLQDRLLVFRFEQGGRRLLAPNPVLAEDLRAATLDPAMVFGAGGGGIAGGASGAGRPGAGSARGMVSHNVAASAAVDVPPVTAADAVALFVFLFQFPGSIRKGGSLTKKAQERALAILPEALRGPAGAGDAGLQGQGSVRAQGPVPSDAAAALAAALGMAEPTQAASALSGGRIGALLEAFDAAGFLGSDGDAREADLATFSAALGTWGERLPAYLAAALVVGPDNEDPAWPRQGDLLDTDAAILAEALAAAPAGFAFSRGGLGRWLETALRRARRGPEAQPTARRRDLIEALVGLGIVGEDGEACLVRAPWSRLADAAVEGELRPAGGQAGEAGNAPQEALPRGAAAETPNGKASLVAEGSHAIHLMPEAGLEERLFLGVLARPESFGRVWSFEVDRESARRAFSAGLGAAEAVARIAQYAKRPLPQSLSFSLKAWEEEFRALRFYRGYVLVADERLRPIVERSRALAPRIAERLAPGVYVLAVSGPEEAAELIEEAGLEPPPETHYGPASRPAFSAGGPQGPGLAQAAPAVQPLPGPAQRLGQDGGAVAGAMGGAVPPSFRLARAAIAPLAALGSGAAGGAGAGSGADGAAGEGEAAGTASPDARVVRPRFDPRPRLELLAAALDATAFGMEDFPDEEGEAAGGGPDSRAAGGAGAGAGTKGGAMGGVFGGAAGTQSAFSSRQRPPRGPAELRELSDRIERRLILTPRQLLRADVKPEHLEAAGLDYLGKVRIVERALRGPGNRLEILYRLPGAEPVRVLARPVRLEKAEKGLVLEAEDLGTGSPLRIPLGAMSSVRMMRASLFGDDT